jgi:hypothetical protein
MKFRALLITGALIFGSSARAQLNDMRFTQEVPFPRKNQIYYQGDSPYQKLLDLMLVADNPQHAYEITHKKFGEFPLAFVPEGDGVLLIVSFRDLYIKPRRD